MCSLASGTQTEPAEKQCAVCYTDLDLKNTVITPCNHAYCNGCFFKWLSRKETCALCRKPLLSNALVEERLEELQDVQGELMESYHAHRVIKRDLKRKRKKIKHLTDDVNSLMGRQARMRLLLDKTKLACEETVKRNNVVQEALKHQRKALKMLKNYKKEWEELHTPLVEEKYETSAIEEKVAAEEDDDDDVQNISITVEELAAIERRRALRDYARWDTNRTMRRLATIRAREGIEEESGEEEEVVVEAETEEDNNTEEDVEEEDVAEVTTEAHEYDTGDEYELRVTGTNIASELTTPPQRRILRIPRAPIRRGALPSQSMFIFGANRDSPNTITHSVSSPFEMPAMFDNSTSTIPLDFNPHINLFTQSLRNESDVREFLRELNMEQPPPYTPPPIEISGQGTQLFPVSQADENSWPLNPGHRAMTRLFNSSPETTTEEAQPPEEISNE
tara:strand:- start:112 stop:1458 length:1347 start_codon:yes stop_codon:yes gene_type:complete